jgi:hypothetical protein
MADKKNYVLITLHTTGLITKIVQAKEPPLEQLQAIVGGYVQIVPHFSQLAYREDKKVSAYNRGSCFANEDGKLPHLNLPVNVPATELWKGQYAYVDQWLVGDLVFVARTTEPCT